MIAAPPPSTSAPRPPGLWKDLRVEACGWALTLMLCAGAVCLLDYHPHDADSRLYAEMVADMSATPLATWCAPAWNGHWNRQGLFYEHPPGHLWVGAALVRAGVPAAQALLWVNFAAFFLGLGLLYRLGQYLGGRPLGALAVLGWALTPAFLQYLVRGDQEHPLTCALLLGLYALVAVRPPLLVMAVWCVALTASVLLKGVAGLALLPVALLYWLTYERSLGRAVALLVGSGGALVVAWSFDAWYQASTGTSFWAHYFAGQVAHSVGRTASLADKVVNLVYYLARPLWYGLPVVGALGLVLYRRLRDPALRTGGKAWALGLMVAAVFIGGFSLANRKADRYIFPVYPALALTAAWGVLHLQALRQRHARLFRRCVDWAPYLLMALVLVGVFAKIYVGTYHYSFIRWWPGA
jgi:4-amino-4-deoxy-L-arabinose transferase-like glycosyltransferase